MRSKKDRQRKFFHFISVDDKFILLFGPHCCTGRRRNMIKKVAQYVHQSHISHVGNVKSSSFLILAVGMVTNPLVMA